jgi:hypothetical protein
MTDMDNVVSLPGADDADAGFRQQKYRRKKAPQRKRKQTSLSRTFPIGQLSA